MNHDKEQSATSQHGACEHTHSVVTCFECHLKLKADAARYREALESIAKSTCCRICQEALLVAKAALSDSGGGK